MNPPRHACVVVLGSFLALAGAHAQSPLPDASAVRSMSGQFVVSRETPEIPVFRKLPVPDGTNLIRLNPALLAVAAERFKISLWHQLGIAADASWSGRIFLAVQPARSVQDAVAIRYSPFLDHWNYRVEFPDVLTKTRYARALTAVLLLELANRSAKPTGHSAEIPAWFVDGMARTVLAADGERVVVSAPAKKNDGQPSGRLDETAHNFDALATARPVLQNTPALTFDQLSWPSETQMEGQDGGIYFASAQLFLTELLALNHGPEKMRAFLAELPGHLNWQLAFFRAFRDDFKNALDVEKWWALRVVNFVARAPGPRWTSDVSRDRLASLLSVPVEFRSNSNALPAHAEISLQAALKSLPPDQREMVARIKVRDLSLVELRLGPPFGELADGYRLALMEFLGDAPKPGTLSFFDKHQKAKPVRPGTGVAPAEPSSGAPVRRAASLDETLKQLDVLDRRRREAENRAVIGLPGNTRPRMMPPGP